MANTLTISSLTELLFQAKDSVVAEPTGFIPSVLVNSGSEGVSLGGTVTSHVTAQPTLNTSYSPAMIPPDGDDQTITTETMTIGQVARVNIPVKGETFKQIQATSGYENVKRDLFAQAIRSIRNAIEARVASVVYKGASRAHGTAGTTPFASNFNDINSVRKILQDNGGPIDDGQWSLVINTAAGVNLRNLTQLQKVNESGNDALLRRGELLNLAGFSIKESAQIQTHTKGAGTGALINNASTEAVGETTLAFDTMTVNTTGIKDGDVITYAADTVNKYVVKTGSTSTSGNIVINKPGLLIAAPDNNAITVGNSYAANVAFHRSAVELVMRPPYTPPEGVLGDSMVVRDDKTGLVFQVTYYPGYGMGTFEFVTLYDVKVWKPEYVATLIG